MPITCHHQPGLLKDSNSSKVGSWLYRSDNQGFYCSKQLLKICGYQEQDQPTFAEHRTYIYQEDAGDYLVNLEKAINFGIGYDYKFRFYRKNDRKIIYLRSIAKPFKDEQQNVTEIYTTVIELTGDEETVHQLMNDKKIAEQAYQQQSKFIANLSHELRNYLGVMHGLEDALASYNNIALDDDAQYFLSVITNTSGKMLQLTDQILDFTKLTANEHTLNLVNFDLAQELQSLIRIYSILARKRGLVLLLNYSASIPNNFLGDVAKISQIISNFLSNAIKFTHCGTVEIIVKLLELSKDKAQLAISVKDSGIGIDKSCQHHIFEKFAQANEQISHEYGGSGLGLAIAKKAAKAMKATITVESNIDQGSVFTLLVELALPAVV